MRVVVMFAVAIYYVCHSLLSVIVFDCPCASSSLLLSLYICVAVCCLVACRAAVTLLLVRRHVVYACVGRPSLLGWMPSLLGWRSSLPGWTPLLLVAIQKCHGPRIVSCRVYVCVCVCVIARGDSLQQQRTR